MSAHHRSASWRSTTRKQRPLIAASLPRLCVNGCGHSVLPEQAWDVGHIVSVVQGRARGWTTAMIDAPSNLGPAHVKCNRSDGGKEGRAKQLARHKANRRLLQW